MDVINNPQNTTQRSFRKPYWKISTFILAILLVLSTSLHAYFFYTKVGDIAPTISIPPSTVSSPPNRQQMKGILKQGSDFEAGRNMCAEGIFLVAEEGAYLTGEVSTLLITTRSNQDERNQMYQNSIFINQKVIVTGEYDKSAMRCKALSCECANDLLIQGDQDIRALAEARIFRGTIDCLPHRSNVSQTLECAAGFKNDENKYYGIILKDADLNKFSPEDRVEISGSIVKNKMPDLNYDTVGTIEVVSIKILN